MLKRIAMEGGTHAIPFLVLVLDYLEDGKIDGFGLFSSPIVLGD